VKSLSRSSTSGYWLRNRGRAPLPPFAERLGCP
jgi:hypothetical protein